MRWGAPITSSCQCRADPISGLIHFRCTSSSQSPPNPLGAFIKFAPATTCRANIGTDQGADRSSNSFRSLVGPGPMPCTKSESDPDFAQRDGKGQSEIV